MEIKNSSNIDGKGLFSTKIFLKDSIIYTLTGEIKCIPDKYTIQIDKEQHITDKLGKYINHSFNPNVKIKGRDIIAIKDINPGDEILYNYNDNENIMAKPFYQDGVLVSGKNDYLIKERFKIKNPHKDSITIENIESIIGLLGFTSKTNKSNNTN